MSDYGWKLLWRAPRSKDPGGLPLGLGRISARDAYLRQRSLERYNRRPDAVKNYEWILRGELGVVQGFTIHCSTEVRQDDPVSDAFEAWHPKEYTDVEYERWNAWKAAHPVDTDSGQTGIIDRTADSSFDNSLLDKPKSIDYSFRTGVVSEHNFPCPVFPEQHALHDGDSGVYGPSWLARAHGWRLVCMKPHREWLIRLLFRFMFNYPERMGKRGLEYSGVDYVASRVAKQGKP